MENNRDDLVVILAGYKDKMDLFFQSNPGMRSRIDHHIDLPDYRPEELLAIAKLMLASQNYRFSTENRPNDVNVRVGTRNLTELLRAISVVAQTGGTPGQCEALGRETQALADMVGWATGPIDASGQLLDRPGGLQDELEI